MNTNAFLLSDEFLVTAFPVIIYWFVSGIYEVLLRLKRFEKYRLHSKAEEDHKNIVSKIQVLKGVGLQQAIQVFVSFVGLKVKQASEANQAGAGAAHSQSPTWTVMAQQFAVAMVVFDTWQYFMHRLMHKSRFLYRNIHSWHHRLVVPYAFGAQYNHPLDGLLVEAGSGAAAAYVSGMSARTAALFFTFATVKGIDDHCGLMLPRNPFHALFENNTAYHGIHHQLTGGKYNFSQPFFVFWDKILGTYAPYALVNRRGEGGGFEAHQIVTNKE